MLTRICSMYLLRPSRKPLPYDMSAKVLYTTNTARLFRLHLQQPVPLLQIETQLTQLFQHGILGSAECLEEQQHSALSAELIRSITSCGNTLLDVVCLLVLRLSITRVDRHLCLTADLFLRSTIYSNTRD